MHLTMQTFEHAEQIEWTEAYLIYLMTAEQRKRHNKYTHKH